MGFTAGVDVRSTTLIARPRAEVACFMFDPANDTEWTGGITASRPAQAGLLAIGSTVERDARFLGRAFTYRYIVTAHDPDRMVELTVDRSFPMTVRYQLEDRSTGTLVAIHAAGTPGRYFGWASPVMSRAVRKSISADLERLKRCLSG